ncbi:hypothetical protein [Sinorhizobium meliloti]|uniref:hypothetical protein n=1 Tax=Rhizobium meliloti TaxID=382 RepID=UPI000B498873|nr:hypothetical protein [Sinorhizobium meliloti]ASQ10657.1 hypothetical protein CDO22_11065 [Sinorhizobium meliloti]MDW9440961.1 hypothetical protein [Sinorhizobium meliloti]MQU81510.1 hypothetical protein [Sinorhizobium meliloti]MQU87262.1 hypothetical protein [Sinorhizobium meliloti]
MDYRIYELVSSPFDGTGKRAYRGGETGDLYPLYERVFAFGQELAATILPNDNLQKLYLDLKLSVEKATLESLQPNGPWPTLPVLYEGTVHLFLQRAEALQKSSSQEELRQLCIALFCALLVEFSAVEVTGVNLDTSALATSLHAEVASYVSWRTFSQLKSDVDLGISNLTSGAEEKFNSVIGSAQDQIQKMIERDTALQQQDSLLRARIQEILGGVQSEAKQLEDQAAAAHATFSKVLEQSKENEDRIALSQESIKRHADAIREELRIDSTRKLWQRRANEGTFAFWISALAIAGFLVGPIAYSFSHLEDLISTLRLIGDAATTGIDTGESAGAAQLTANAVARLAVITVPLAVYFWGVKLLVRYNARSMMLMDDARQRQTMMEVYTHLIEHNGATSEERALVLNALFRPAPGHGPENVEPPNFTELLSKASAK